MLVTDLDFISLQAQALEPKDSRTLHRCGFFPDLFATREGEIFQLNRVPIYRQGKYRVAKYNKNTVMALHLMADAFHPDWQEEYDRVIQVDENPDNLHADNLAFTKSDGSGRQRNNRLQHIYKIIACYKACRDAEAVASECNVAPSEVKRVVNTYCRRLIPSL